ncbi:LOW QUALITY PROTEIN: serine carboxypeptidase-like 45 [Eucalyptus grandis]|uniref:LOW QUALITY PROTEIN: serine carboxypeptidase-like 45 n=1 Tax=Eucalyptus grandis TaxID=71139 RepID=UPI00192ED042|nr:LOW QUALITY PROTEIN: serine carboxypeptidase-like 45 [Eucalyptus grandis]
MSQPWLILTVITCSILMQACKPVTSLSDKILSLPGQPSVGFSHYSGYITVGDHPPRALFYYFVEAETSPASKPLVLWLNGGPGCSSLGYGAFIEHGPFKVKGGGLVKRDYSWNKVANLLYLESPAGVGFSYSTSQSFYKGITDNITAQDNLVFLQHWFTKYPQYKGRDFFITGESYAGHYVPELAQLIVKSKVEINLKGIAIGNPLLDYENDTNSPTTFYWSHGIISDQSELLFQNVCNLTRLLGEIRSKALTSECAYVVLKVAKELNDTEAIDQYDILADLCLTSGQSKLNIFYKMLTSGHSLPSVLPSEDLINYQSLLDTKDPCEEQDVIKYFNRKDVQIALHAKLVGVGHWNTCSDDINENFRFEDRYISMIPILGELVKSGLRVLVYSGDLDAVVPFLGTRTMVDALATKVLKRKTTLSYRAWFTSKQVAGYTQEYGKLAFATIKGASHTAPATQPERSLQLFTSFLKGKSLPTKA